MLVRVRDYGLAAIAGSHARLVLRIRKASQRSSSDPLAGADSSEGSASHLCFVTKVSMLENSG
jgi:hypothetical protein